MWKSPRSGRVYSDPIEIEGRLVVEILYCHHHDGIKKGEIITWFEDSFPAFLRKVPQELEQRALSGESYDSLFRGISY